MHHRVADPCDGDGERSIRPSFIEAFGFSSVLRVVLHIPLFERDIVGTQEFCEQFARRTPIGIINDDLSREFFVICHVF